MNFEHANYLPFIAGAITLLVLTVIFLEKKFFSIVKLYWFYKRSFFSHVSSVLFLTGMAALLISLLDFRGPEERIKGGVPTDRTIILIDTSASMLAEDVKPSRLQKAALIAKHFARKAAGHQLSIVAFAEIQKKIVPFTSDLDLIDARLDSIKNLRNQNGSSALSAAIQESIQYFKETGETRGNILILTDGEETAESINLNVPKEIYIALVGIGTNQGGRIPLDDGRGFRFGYKKSQGKDVITKLNEDFFKQVTADIPNSQYWLANTYSLPSDDILGFFKGQKANGEKQQDMVIKPVMMEWVVIPALVLLILSYAMKAVRVFSLGLLLLVLPLYAQETPEPELSPEVLDKLELLQDGELNQLEKIKLADQLQRSGAHSEALALYEENLPTNKIDPNIPPEAYLNYGAALLERGQAQKGLEIYDTLSNRLDSQSDQGKKIKNLIEKNIVNFFKVQEQKQQEKKKQDQENKDNQDKNKDNQQSSGNSQDQKNQSQSGNNHQKDPKQGEEPQQDKNDKGDQGEEKKDKDKDKDDDGKDNDQTKDQKDKDQEGEKKKLPPQKIPAKLKQLMSDDRQLQLKIIEQNTRDMNRRKSRQNKDW
jgi:Ca-activated chloride channel homolog